MKTNVRLKLENIIFLHNLKKVVFFKSDTNSHQMNNSRKLNYYFPRQRLNRFAFRVKLSDSIFFL